MVIISITSGKIGSIIKDVLAAIIVNPVIIIQTLFILFFNPNASFGPKRMQASAVKAIQKINYNFLGVFLKIIGNTIAEIKFGIVPKPMKNIEVP